MVGNQTGNERLREFMDKLAVSNVSRHVELPMIAVMGDTSSGKSSLLTAISMVELLSSVTLTTRCPIILQTKRAEQRTAKITVEWKEQETAEQGPSFLKEVDEETWASLTEYIAEAQAHILKAKHKTGTNDVSRDIVQVRVTGPDCEDLTLIDLPGIVRSTGAGESASLVDDIQSLIDDYLKNSRCVILAVHPANVDFHNSQIMADAKKVDPQTKRTLPVITKPDLIDRGAKDAVKELLLGLKTDKFEKGFHMVKCRGQKALNDQTVRRVIKAIEDLVVGQSLSISRKRKRVSLAADFHALCDSFGSQLLQGQLAGISKLSKGTKVVVSDAMGEFTGVIDSFEGTDVFVDPDDPECQVAKHHIIRDTKTPDNYEMKAIMKSNVRRDASWIKEHLMEHRSLLDLPIFPNSSVFNGIVSGFIEDDWEPLCYELLESALKLLRNIIKRVLSVDKCLVNYPRLAKLLKTRMDEVAQALFDSARADLANYLEKEKKPYTQNDYLTENITRLRLQWLQNSIYQSLGLEGKIDKNSNLSKTQVKATIDAVFNRNRKKSLGDHMAEDLQHCLDAYGKVAYKWFADEVPKICKEILVNFARRAEASLSILPDEEKLDELISASTETQEKYTYLRAKVSDLEEGLRTIESLSF